ncbi:MOB kinase activator 2-like [Arapaima gigas]
MSVAVESSDAPHHPHLAPPFAVCTWPQHVWKQGSEVECPGCVREDTFLGPPRPSHGGSCRPHLLADMGGCHSSGSATKGETPTKKVEFSDITAHKLKNNNSKVAPSLEEKPYLQKVYVSEGISQVDMVMLSVLPRGIDQSEWIASNTLAFFTHVNLLSGTMSEFCTPRSCPAATGPGNTTYYWTDEHGRKLKCSAPLYIDYTMSYIQELLTDEEVFPTRAGCSFPNGYIFLVQKVFLYLFHTLAHLYWAHFHNVVEVEMHPHLNTLLAHLITFAREFELLEECEMAPLEDLISTLLQVPQHTTEGLGRSQNQSFKRHQQPLDLKGSAVTFY